MVSWLQIKMVPTLKAAPNETSSITQQTFYLLAKFSWSCGKEGKCCSAIRQAYSGPTRYVPVGSFCTFCTSRADLFYGGYFAGLLRRLRRAIVSPGEAPLFFASCLAHSCCHALASDTTNWYLQVYPFLRYLRARDSHRKLEGAEIHNGYMQGGKGGTRKTLGKKK